MKKCSLLLVLFSIWISTTGASCILMQRALDKGETLSPEQIKAYNEMGMDVYGCFTIGGPPPVGNTTWIVVPKNSPQGTSFVSNCQILPQQLKASVP